MNVLVLTTTFPRWRDDTTPTFVYELSKRLNRKKDLNITVLAPHHPGAKEFETIDDMKVYRFPYFYPKKYQRLCYGILPNLKVSYLAKIQVPFLVLSELIYTAKIIKREKIDLIHAHWVIPSGFVGALIKKIYIVPFIVTIHGGDIFGLQGKIPTALKKFTLLNADKITVPSNPIKKGILEKIDSSLKSDIISMGVDPKLFNPNKKDNSIKEKYEIDDPFLLFVGRLAEKKGVKYLIQAMQEIIKSFPKTKLMIIGMGILENELKDLTKKFKLENHIIFTGGIPNDILPDYYATADIFIGPSIQTKGGDTEGLGVVFLEAMASGIPVIGSNIGGITDVIKDNYNGFLIEPKSPEDIAEKVIKLLEDKKLQEKFKENGLKTAKEKFDWEIIAQKFYQTYKNVSEN